MTTVLVTGGAGFIGSHTTLELLQTEEYDVIVVDNLANSKREALDRVEDLSERKPVFYKADLLDKPALEKIFAEHEIDSLAVAPIHDIRS